LNLRAFEIWKASGSPTGEAGEAVKEENWHKAERQLFEELKRQTDDIDRHDPTAPPSPCGGVTGPP
jgi:Protein of unknown function (DUF2934)